MSKIKKAIAGLSDEKFSIQVGHLVEETTGNANFPTPNPTMAALSAKNDLFWEKVQAIKNGNRTPDTVAAKNLLKVELIGMVGTFFNYVVNTGLPFDKQLTSGFPPAKDRTQPEILPMPVNFVVSPSGKNKVKSRFNAVKGAKSYLYQHRAVGSTGEWFDLVDTRCKVTFFDLPQGTCHEFRVCAVNSKGQSEFTDVMNCYVS